MNIGFDGVGTKMEIAERINNHRTIAYDLFAMVCDDAVVRGAEPVLIGSILDVNSLGKGEETYIEQIRQLAEGYINAANDAGVAIVNGEVAELGNRIGGYGPFNYNWGAAVVWFAKKDRLFTGNEIKKGDKVVGLRELGFRSNGLSLVRKILQENYGDEWHKKKFDGTNQTLGKVVLTPSKIYSKAVCEMFGGYANEPKAEVHGVVHITGGGLPGKLGRVLKPSGLGAEIINPYTPAKIMDFIQNLGNVPDEEAYKTWNMGQGMVVVTPDPGKVQNIANNYGVGAIVMGEIVDTPRIRIRNKGVFKNQSTEFLEFKE